jgi:hypothetical protein
MDAHSWDGWNADNGGHDNHDDGGDPGHDEFPHDEGLGGDLDAHAGGHDPAHGGDDLGFGEETPHNGGDTAPDAPHDSGTPEEPLAFDGEIHPAGTHDADVSHHGNLSDGDAPEEPLALDGHDADASHHDVFPGPGDHTATPDDHGDSQHTDHDTPYVGTDHIVGADPDLTHHTDDTTWADPAFPPALEFGHPPEPVDGFPWSDPTLLGDPTAHHVDAGGDPFTTDQNLTTPSEHDLAEYAGADLPSHTDAWTALLDSDDPATSGLARWWAPDH